MANRRLALKCNVPLIFGDFEEDVTPASHLAHVGGYLSYKLCF